jgi:hypothetical protein
MTRRGLVIGYLVFASDRTSVAGFLSAPPATPQETGLTDPLEALLIIAAGMAAGTVNTIVGSGSLITFPTLVLLGYPPLVANVSNTIGLVPGSISGSIGYRHELTGQRARAIALAGVYLTGIYGGYFGAAQGVILIALLSILIDDELQRLNGLKNVLATVVNAVAAIIFILVAPVAWGPAILLAIGSTIGGQLGAVAGRRLSPSALRAAIITIGTIVAVRLLIG